ncbi:hypothetical protein PA0269 [Candidatus Phytoplasma australiense]|uniref:Uncharacterized protein n=1 Tax=Phytoplasma australiense TaxID=59748 RepID=B1V9I2_PHYAS|nr:hypothetical protein PA0269 [Candidatus Phytoplasma australiense]
MAKQRLKVGVKLSILFIKFVSKSIFIFLLRIRGIIFKYLFRFLLIIGIFKIIKLLSLSINYLVKQRLKV